MAKRKRVGIATVYKGYNYGSCLQAYATQEFLKELGYSPVILGLRSELSGARHLGRRKAFVMFLRAIWRPSLVRGTVLAYLADLRKPVARRTRELFADFRSSLLHVDVRTWGGLKAFASAPDTVACVCGSDQVWNASAAYLDPVYYLRFAPQNKRIAFAPSFGRAVVPRYNYGPIKKRISAIPFLSVREGQGARIIEEMTGRTAAVLVGPTLLLDKPAWISRMGDAPQGRPSGNDVVLYFLDPPNDVAVEFIRRLVEHDHRTCVTVMHPHDRLAGLAGVEHLDAGPREFVHLVANAGFVCTDSFHGTAFAVNFSIPFCVFDRQYGAAADQSCRIESLLEMTALQSRFVRRSCDLAELGSCDFGQAQERLAQERQTSKAFLLDAFSRIEVDS